MHRSHLLPNAVHDAVNACPHVETTQGAAELEAQPDLVTVQLKAEVLSQIKEMVPQAFTLAIEQPGYEAVVPAARHVKAAKLLTAPLS